MTTSLDTYRDATFSAATRDQLEEARALMENVAKDVHPDTARGMWPLIEAIEEVIARWDANDATEITLP
jgi:hypothetical protein